MKIDLDGYEESFVVPGQKMPGKTIRISRIEDVRPYGQNRKEIPYGRFEDAFFVVLGLKDCTAEADRGILFLDKGGSEELLLSFGIEYPLQLKGEVVLGVYENSGSRKTPCGIIPTRCCAIY